MGPNGVNRQEKVYKNDKNKRKETNRSKIVTNSRTRANSSPVPRTKKTGHPFGCPVFLLYGPRCAPAALFVPQASLDGMGSAAEAPPAPVTARELASGCRNKCPWGTADEARRQKGNAPVAATNGKRKPAGMTRTQVRAAQ